MPIPIPSRHGSVGSAGTLEPKGSIVIDKGAAEALTRGKSLLAAGVTKIEGAFERGDAVVIRNGDGAELGRGLAAYDHEDARRIIGRKSGELAEISATVAIRS